MFNILPYSAQNLANSLCNSFTSEKTISEKHHFLYLKDYLSSPDINCRTLLIEEKYISKDYLQDFASYYAFCYQDYPKFTRRIHFFDSVLTEQELINGLLEENNETRALWTHYLGFIVVKPIPSTIIGYTVLKTYASSQNFNERNFWGVRDYKIHVFGKEVCIKSLAFQEQDSVLAACATTAIWSMLNKAALDFHTILKSPSQITKDADNVSLDGSRLFPNKGLSILQICQAIFNSGLVTEVKHPDVTRGSEPVVSCRYLKKILSAYSPIGIPIILVIQVPNGGIHGLHAITISGFKQNAPQVIAPQLEIGWLADNIEKFYAHDDQWGPFVRVEFLSDTELNTPWTVFDANKEPTLISNIIVPVYPKVRISYEDIEAIVLGLDGVLTLFFDNMITSDLVWDVKIHYSEQFKQSTIDSNLDRDEKLQILSESLPKYLWVASCYVGSLKLFDFTFDATDVSNGMIGKHVICYLQAAEKSTVLDFLTLNDALLRSLFTRHASTNYYDFLLKNLQ